MVNFRLFVVLWTVLCAILGLLSVFTGALVEDKGLGDGNIKQAEITEDVIDSVKGGSPIPDVLLDSRHAKERPHEADVEASKYLSFSWNGGRTNNQMMSLQSAIVLAREVKRVLIFPRCIRGRSPRSCIFGVGMFVGAWDMRHLAAFVPYLMPFTEGHQKEYNGLPEILPQCTLINPRTDQLQKVHLNPDCQRIHINGDAGIILHLHGADDYFDAPGPNDEFIEVMKFLRPAKYLRDAVDNFVVTHFGEAFHFSVHNRMMLEGKPDPSGETHLCRQASRNIFSDRGRWARNAIARGAGNQKEIQEAYQIYYRSCAMTYEDIVAIAKWHGKEVPDKWYVASDKSDKTIWSDNVKHNAISWSKQEIQSFSRADLHVKAQEQWCGNDTERSHGCFSAQDFMMLEEILVDMWTLTKATYFIGSWYSTLTQNVCRWRKGNNISDSSSTLCGLKSRWARGNVRYEASVQ